MRRNSPRFTRRSTSENADHVRSLSPHTRLRGDYGIASGGTTWTDMVSGRVFTHISTVTLANPAELGSRPAIRLNGTTEYLTSNNTATTWKFMHDGTGYEAWLAYVPRFTLPTSKTTFILATHAAVTQIGASLAFANAASTQRFAVGNGVNILNLTTGAATSGVGYYAYGGYLEGASTEAISAAKGLTSGTGNSTGAPSSSDPTQTLWIGAATAGTCAQVDIAEIVIFNRQLTTAERVVMTSYMARYGL